MKIREVTSFVVSEEGIDGRTIRIEYDPQNIKDAEIIIQGPIVSSNPPYQGKLEFLRQAIQAFVDKNALDYADLEETPEGGVEEGD